MRTLALQVPNPADPDVPDGGEDEGDVVRTVGEPGPAPARDHAAFGEAMGFVDAEHGAEVGGSRFAYVLREAVLLELALVQWVMGRLVREGFVPVVPPVLVREHVMEEAGFFPTDRNQVYDLPADELFLVGTSEVPLSALHRGELLDAARLPLRYAGLSTNFRREAGTYGKDTRGIFRVHQFDKVEMFAFVAPEDSDAEHERILAIEELIIGGLGLPYRVVNIAAGDLGPAAAREVRHRGLAAVGRRIPRGDELLELPRLLRPAAADARARRLRHRVGAHPQRHRVRDQPHARVPLRALPAGRRLVRGPRRARPPHRLRHRLRPVIRRPPPPPAM